METVGNNYTCNICNKIYNTRGGLWKHNSKYHNTTISSLCVNDKPNITKAAPNSTNITPNITKTAPNSTKTAPKCTNNNIKIYICNYCNVKFSRNYTLKKHNNRCKFKNNENNVHQENEMLKQQLKQQSEEINLLKKKSEEINSIKQQLLQLINKKCKTHPKTLQKINNQLNANNINVNNITYNIMALGYEDLTEVFSKKEKLKVLQNRRSCLDYIVKYTHFNDKYPQFKNIMITNTQNDLAYKFDKNENKFIAISKEELLNDLIDERISDIILFYEELDEELDDRTKKIINKFLEQINDDKFKDIKKKDIKFIIYNNRDKVNKDLEIII